MFRIRILTLLLGVLSSAWLAQTNTASAQNSFTLRASETSPELLVYPPKSTRPSPVVMMLHGMCDAPENECPRFAEAVTEQAWLVCPRGDVVCSRGGATWSVAKRRELPSNVLSYLKTRFDERIDSRRGHTLMGFSLGAIAAVDAISHHAGDFTHLVLIGAKVEPSASVLRRVGISNVVMMAGQWDMMWAHMHRHAKRLELEGMSAQFIDLGQIGHWFPLDANHYLRQALRFFYAEGIA